MEKETLESSPLFVCPISKDFCLMEMNEPGAPPVLADETLCMCGWFKLTESMQKG